MENKKNPLGLEINIDAIADQNVRIIVRHLLNIVENQSAEIEKLKTENQKLRDENNQLKGGNGKLILLHFIRHAEQSKLSVRSVLCQKEILIKHLK